MRAALIIVAGLLAACSKPNAKTAPETAPPPASAATNRKAACDLVTVEEMGQILGKTVVATPSGGNKCHWAPPEEGMTFAELEIGWGDGEVAMQAFSQVTKIEKDMDKVAGPYDDLGDEAMIIGPVVMVKRGEDLFQIQAWGTDDAEAAVHKIYGLVTSRL